MEHRRVRKAFLLVIVATLDDDHGGRRCPGGRLRPDAGSWVTLTSVAADGPGYRRRRRDPAGQGHAGLRGDRAGFDPADVPRSVIAVATGGETGSPDLSRQP